MLLLMYRGISNGNIKTKEQYRKEQEASVKKLLALCSGNITKGKK